MSDRKEFILSKIKDIKDRQSLGRGTDQDGIDLPILESELAQIEAAEKELAERSAEQEEKIESIELPYDLEDIFSDDTYKNEAGRPYKATNLNEMVMELVKTEVRKVNDDNNVSAEKLHTYYQEQLKASQEREIQWQRQAEETQAQLTEERGKINALELERDDYEQRFDNAAAQLVEKDTEIAQLKSWNDDLHKQIAIGERAAQRVIESSDRLTAMIEEKKQSKVKSSLELALERTEPFRGTFRLPEVKPEPTESPFRPSEPNCDQLPSTQEAAAVGEQFQVESPEIPAVQPVESEMANREPGVQDAPVTRTEVRAIVQEELKKWGIGVPVNMKADGQVA